MTEEELKLASNRVLGMEHYQDEVQYVCEGDADCAEVMNMITYSSARAGGTSMRSIGRIHTFMHMYGSRYKYIPTKVKKGVGKGRSRLQRVTTKSRNSFDNLTWINGE